MRKLITAGLIGLLMFISYVLGRHHSQPATESAHTRRILYWVDPMHPNYRSDHPGTAPDCGMQLEPVYADSAPPPGQTVAVRGAIEIDPASQRLVGIRVATPEKTSGTHTVRFLGRVVPEDTRTYLVNSGMDGFIRETFGDSVGEFVKKDQRLATSYVGDTLSVASGFLAATAAVPGSVGKDGARTTPFPGAVAKQGVSSLQGYTDRLRNLGLSEAQIRQMAQDRQLPETVDIVSPADGFILARNVTPGQHFERSTEFYRIADLSQVWIVADVFGSDAQDIHAGTVARVTVSDQRGTFSARVTNALPQVDPATKVLKLRLEAKNSNYSLRPDMFVDVELPVEGPAGVTVPRDAVIDSGHKQQVFVERSAGVFEPRNVQIGWISGDRVEIIRGLAEGERVVVEGTFLVDSESRLKSSAPLADDKTAQPTNPSKI
jgi:membrane fusion protein, copper/silver efflux system